MLSLQADTSRAFSASTPCAREEKIRKQRLRDHRVGRWSLGYGRRRLEICLGQPGRQRFLRRHTMQPSTPVSTGLTRPRSTDWGIPKKLWAGHSRTYAEAVHLHQVRASVAGRPRHLSVVEGRIDPQRVRRQSAPVEVWSRLISIRFTGRSPTETSKKAGPKWRN